MPRRSTRTDVRTLLPTAHAAIDHLNNAGQPALADAVRVITEYAERAADQAEQRSKTDLAAGQNRSIGCAAELKSHFDGSAAAAGVTIAEVVERHFRAYMAGTWTPTAPARNPRGTVTESAKINVRVTDDLWDRVQERAQNPALNSGQKMTARRVALAALLDEFPLPE